MASFFHRSVIHSRLSKTSMI